MKLVIGSFAIFLAVFFSIGNNHLYAQPNTLYFMKGIPQTKDVNPARPGIAGGFYFSMPFLSKIDLSANTNNWSYNDLIHRGTYNGLSNTINNTFQTSDSLVIDIDKFRESIDKKNFLFESAALTILEGGYKKGDNFYSVSITEREFAELFFHKNLIDLIKLGNYPYVGQTYYSGNYGINMQHYREFTFNYSRDINKKLTVGAAAKILFGMGVVHTNGMNFKIASPPLGDYLDVSVSGKVNISAPVDFNYNSRGLITSVAQIPNYSIRNYLTNLKNPGIAFDLGMAYRISKKTELSASVIDLGFIGWNSNVTRLAENGNFVYRGVDLNDPNQPEPYQLSPIINDLKDSIISVFRPDTTGTNFATLLPTKIYFGIDHQINDFVSVSGLARVRILNNQVHTSVTAAANAYLFDALSISASYSLMESTYDNIGLGLGFKINAVQLYAASDNLFSPFHPAKARNMNLRFGINFIFGDGRDSKTRGSLNPNCHCPY
jgi:hypothetical protein